MNRRKGTPEQVAAYDQAVRDLSAYPCRTETPEYHRLNDRVSETAGPLSPWQQSAWARGVRLDRADRRMARATRRTR